MDTFNHFSSCTVLGMCSETNFKSLIENKRSKIKSTKHIRFFMHVFPIYVYFLLPNFTMLMMMMMEVLQRGFLSSFYLHFFSLFDENSNNDPFYDEKTTITDNTYEILKLSLKNNNSQIRSIFIPRVYLGQPSYYFAFDVHFLAVFQKFLWWKAIQDLLKVW